ncbi:histidine phosphatase family protein (plasmid) [Paraclostridium bifermentans]|uniref:Histidine phosphatase family protein n=1 Tax=Paraclostridium bifermentans TaxID=1490 RepID=A0ABY8R7Z8_PARBF|nr:histidine phosphatase family protein [Paraclostridium bifermentans]
MKKIILVQHTQSIHHTNGMIGSWTDWDLSDFGKQQAEVIAINLKEEIKDEKYKIYTSDLLRAKNTAYTIAINLNIEEISCKHELRERNLGEAVGKSVKWLKSNIKKHEESIHDRCFENAESRVDAWNRLKPFYEQIISNEDNNVIIVSHGDLLSLFTSMFLGRNINDLDMYNLFGSSGGVSFLEINDRGNHIIRRFNDISYAIKKIK